ncbi:MAG: hypothetical protein FWF23_00570 [Alphaproteobacteria bacterium]|nr:hypothetical protein [Alphaproteobacteria bacterium]MCL2505155.1 hypothetical protein [Alphaproteobacteria bacterium]
MSADTLGISDFLQFAQKKRNQALSAEIALISQNVSSEIQELRNRELETTLDAILQGLEAA